jgi:hypothetical protein
LGAATAWTICALTAMLAGGWVAGRLITRDRATGWIHGFMVWSVSTAAMILMILLGAGALFGGATFLGGKSLDFAGRPVAAVASESAELAKDATERGDAMLSSFAEEASTSPASAQDPAASIRAKREVGFAVARLFRPGNDVNSPENRAAVVNSLVTYSGMTEAEATQRVNEWTATYNQLRADVESAKLAAEQKAREAADAASKALSIAGLCTFFGYLMGAFIASIAGNWGPSVAPAMSRRRRTTSAGPPRSRCNPSAGIDMGRGGILPARFSLASGALNFRTASPAARAVPKADAGPRRFSAWPSRCRTTPLDRLRETRKSGRISAAIPS